MDAIVKQLKKNPIISKNIVTYNKKISNSGWKYQTNNCVECTFVLENNCCKMCFSKQTHKWNYVNDVDGDTTYQTEYTNEIVNNASEIKALLDQINQLKTELSSEQTKGAGKVLPINIERKSFPSENLGLLIGLFLGAVLGFFFSLIRNAKVN